MDTSSTGAVGAATDSSNANPVYHGSAEQFRDAPRRFSPRPQGSYLNSVTPPRSPSQRVRPSRARRYRSPDPTEDEDDDDGRRADRRERRQSRAASRPPVGEDFRLRACEQILREHTTEIAAHRVALQQLNDAILQNNKDKEVTGQRLDAVFDLVDTRMAEYTGITRNIASRLDAAEIKAESMTAVINELGKNMVERIQLIEAEIIKMQDQNSRPPNQQPPNRPAGPNNASSSGPVPPTPASWSAP